jgi:hypothetical protein
MQNEANKCVRWQHARKQRVNILYIDLQAAEFHLGQQVTFLPGKMNCNIVVGEGGGGGDRWKSLDMNIYNEKEERGWLIAGLFITDLS